MDNISKWIIGLIALAAFGAVIYYLAQPEASDLTGEIPERQENEVQLINIEFVPDSLTVEVGEEVLWTNYDNVEHNIVSEDGLFDQSLGPDQSFRYTFENEGVYEYVCTIHPGMQGRIVVE